MSFNLQEHIPACRYRDVETATWATTGTTDTVTDGKVSENSHILFNPRSGDAAGRWRYTCSQGSFVVTSSNSEAAGLTYDYIIV